MDIKYERHRNFDWEYHINYFLNAEEINEIDKREIIEALNFLKKHFGNGFLKSQARKNHTILFYISNKARHSFLWLIWLKKNLNYFLEQESDSFKSLLKKLKNHKLVNNEGIPFVEISSKLLRAGFNVEIEPIVKDFIKNPDMVIINPRNKEKIYLEVSRLNESDERKMGSILHYNLSLKLLEFYDKAVWGIKIKSIPSSKEELEFIYTSILEIFKKITNSDDIVEINTEAYELVISSKMNEKKVADILAKAGIRLNNIDIDMSYDDTKRVRNNKIRAKAKQLPKNRPGILYFPVDPMYQLTTSQIQVSRKLKMTMSEFPNLIGIVMYSTIGALNKETIAFGFENSFYSEISIFEINMRKLLFIGNDSFNFSLEKETFQKLVNSFEKY